MNYKIRSIFLNRQIFQTNPKYFFGARYLGLSEPRNKGYFLFNDDDDDSHNISNKLKYFFGARYLGLSEPRNKEYFLFNDDDDDSPSDLRQ